MNHKIKARLEWIKLYGETKDAGLVWRRCGISRPTLRKWWRRFQKSGQDGLEDLSRRPKNSPNRKIFEKEIAPEHILSPETGWLHLSSSGDSKTRIS